MLQIRLMTKPDLYVFSISHYCEKAKWALNHLRIDYDLHPLLPGPHIAFAKKLGLRRGALPILRTESEVIQGSSSILDWAESVSEQNLSPNGSVTAEVETRLDDILGVHLRRQFYSEALVEFPATVKPIFMYGLGMVDKLKLALLWPFVKNKMIAAMDLGYEEGLASRAIVEAELAWLDGLLVDGNQYLVNDQFSRADITAASLLAPLVMPEQYPMAKLMQLPPRVSQDRAQWIDRPVFNWVRQVYLEHRNQFNA